ncbi:hypothetical protein DN752_08850 [Echinicola strongylocentroti]|uniref:Metallo-beta-lactamase domain-containing protein n=1 Tax=Echinicola strongylocentroti TaxID=1795355 RepID=A0A2Z4IGI5_9BACT|nr:hypothetical protein [Echinicola strongylocentroti]AWW30222.1 hypothetical protein DN752_08850 [Echinicola strongylocentroti]
MRNLILILSLIMLGNVSNAQDIGQPLPKWELGMLDLHHINTGRGDAAFYVLPDGITMLVDAGESSEDDPRTLSARNTPRLPNTDKYAYEWIADYIFQFGPLGGDTHIDYAVLTHFHSDHFGTCTSYSPRSEEGNYQLTGLVGVGTLIPVKRVLDRDYPSYENSQVKFSKEKIQLALEAGSRDSVYACSVSNYWKFLEYQEKENGMEVSKFLPGKNNQVKLSEATDYPTFGIRNIVGNGWAWTGEGEAVFPLGASNENDLSNGFRVSYGEFDYWTGGDISGVGPYGEGRFNSVEAQIAPVIGPVDVATLNHHGNRDSQSAYYVRTIRPRVWVQQSWSSDHPGDDVLRRISSKELYPGDRDIFTTGMLEANKLVIGDRIDNVYGSQRGHILVRVAPRGKTYQVIILEDRDEKRMVKAVFGPYASR